VGSLEAFGRGCIWVWCHLLLCNVSNQARSGAEDSINRPWRPLPSQRISVERAILLRWVLGVACLALSSLYSRTLVTTTGVLLLTTVLYDDCKLAGHPLGKNLCNILGYNSFQVGATIVISMSFRSCFYRLDHE